jgi:hypothetical protein
MNFGGTMKKLNAILAGSLALVGGGTIALGGPEASTLDPKDVVIEDAGKAVMIEDGSPWFVSAGAVVRSIDAGFRLDGHDHISLDWRHYVKRKSGRGDVGLYGPGSGTKYYDDGFVEEHPNFSNQAGGYVNSASQISPHPVYPDVTLFRNRVVSFHTDDYRYHSSGGAETVHTSDSDSGVGPYVAIGYRLDGTDSLLINLVTGWSYVSTDHQSGSQALAHAAVRESRTVYTYQYDYIGSRLLPLQIPGTVSNVDNGFIVDPSNIFLGIGDPNYSAPRQHDQTTHRTVARFYAVGSSHLDVDLNEIPLGVEVGRSFGKLELFLTGGATLNVIGYDLDSQVSWYQEGHSRALTTDRWRDSGTELKIGLYGGLAAKYPLTADGKFYLEAHGSYRWVDPVHASAGFADVEIDPSSWEGGLGIGIVLD